MNSDQFFRSNAWPQGSHPWSKKSKFLTPGLLLLVKKTQRMIKCPCHRQTCNVKSPSYVQPPPPPPPQRLNINTCRCINCNCSLFGLCPGLTTHRSFFIEASLEVSILTPSPPPPQIRDWNFQREWDVLEKILSEHGGMDNSCNYTVK